MQLVGACLNARRIWASTPQIADFLGSKTMEKCSDFRVK